MILTGYHGTTMANAKKIITEGFRISSEEKNWLGDGIYFYPNFVDAYEWGPQVGRPESEAIFHVIVKIDDTQFLDINTPEGEKIVSGVINIIKLTTKKELKKEDAQRNQCAIMRLIWKLCPDIEVIIAKFPKYSKDVPMIMDLRPYRTEFCLRSNIYICHQDLIERSDICG